MKSTSNHGLQKPEPQIDNVNIDVLNENMDIVDKGLVIYLGTTSGSANTYTIASEDIKALSEGLAVCVKIHTASTAESTLNVNGWGAKTIKKAGGADATNLKAGIYTLRYDGENFILQGEGASGDAAASDLLLGKKATSDAGEITGTMPDIGPVEAETVNLTSQNQEYVIAMGKHSGLRKIKAVITGLIAGVIKAGTTVGGILGTYTSDATATDGDVLSGKFYYRNGVKGTGNIPSKAAQTYTPGAVDQVIDAGQYLSGAQTIKGDPDLIALNIKQGVDIFGIIGTMEQGKKFASGSVVSSTEAYYFVFVGGGSTQYYKMIVSGLSFKPRVIILKTINTQDHVTVYSETGGSLYPKTANIVMTQADGTNLGCYAIKGDVSPAYVVNGGFCLPASTYGRTYTYEAYE